MAHNRYSVFQHRYAITPLDHYKIRLDGGTETTIRAASVGVPVFLKVSALPPGKHTPHPSKDDASIMAWPKSKAMSRSTSASPEPWVPGTTAHAGLVVTL